MNVVQCWIAYVAVVILAWVILTLPQIRSLVPHHFAPFVAALFGALAVWLLAQQLGTLTQQEKMWLDALVIISYALPVVGLIYAVLCIKKFKNPLSPQAKSSERADGVVKESITLGCSRETGQCTPLSMQMKTKNRKVNVLYA